MVGLAGVTAIDCSLAAVTVSVVFADTPVNVAVMTEEPGATLVARPLAAIVATEGMPEVQFTEIVTSWVVPSE